MASNLRVDNIQPSTGMGIGIGTANGSVTFNADVTGGLNVTNGSVGIGTDNPNAAKLDVRGSNNPLLKLTQTTSGIARLNIESETNDGYQYAGIGIGTASADAELMWTTLGFDVNVANSVRLRIPSSGDVQVLTGNLVIGTSGKGIDFSATSDAGGMESELLDDYEEGTWTARLRFGNTTEIGTYNSNSSAEYVKIGKIVHVSGFTQYDSVNTGNTGILTMDLPFAVDEHGQPNNWVYPGSAKLSHSDLLTKGFFALCGNASGARSRFGFYNNTSGSIDYVENSDISSWNGNSNRSLHFNFTYQTNA